MQMVSIMKEISVQISAMERVFTTTSKVTPTRVSGPMIVA